MKEFRQDLKKAGTVSGRTRTPHGLSRVTDDIHHAAFDHEGASATGDGTGTAQRYAPDDENLHGRGGTAVGGNRPGTALVW